MLLDDVRLRQLALRKLRVAEYRRQRVFDFVRQAGAEGTDGGHLFGLHERKLRAPQRPLALFEFVRHVVERNRQLPDFVTGVDVNVDVEITFRDFAHGARERLERLRKSPCHPDRADRGNEDDDQADHDQIVE